MNKPVISIFLFLMIHSVIYGQNTPINFETYNPVSTLVVPQQIVKNAKYPFIDVHNHQPAMAKQDLRALTTAMDSLNMKVMVNLTGYGGDALMAMAANVRQQYPSRFIIFTNLDFSGFGENNWTENAVKRLRKDVSNGAKGLKIFKELGLSYKNREGKRIPVDDNRLDAIWMACGELHIPVLIHSAAPKPFWDLMDDKNERLLEMKLYADRRYGNENFATWDQIIQEQHRMFKKHPKTTFINAHFGWLANNLQELSRVMNDIPNMYIEFGAVIAELGRQPRAAKAFFEKFQDRILFGKDSWVPEEYSTYFRVLETADEYFPYHKKYHAFWALYGINLPDEILKKVYYKNALKIIPGIDKRLFPE
ncbi:MAG TPA: amidohydrolase family protein [Flavisolibacter sp.]|jgi:predicted TIM-barrel fold metal-dependent hydrolase|nr:amidohydrolase family protein [Flavisolibacter sp.]